METRQWRVMSPGLELRRPGRARRETRRSLVASAPSNGSLDPDSVASRAYSVPEDAWSRGNGAPPNALLRSPPTIQAGSLSFPPRASRSPPPGRNGCEGEVSTYGRSL